MNIKEAIDLLRKNGYIVDRYNKVYRVLFPTSRVADYYSPRELINKARYFCDGA